MMNKKEFCKFIGITEQGYYKWRKEKPNLFKILEEYRTKENKQYLVNDNDEIKELLKYFNELNKEEKELYIAEIKARALRKKLG